MLVVVTGRVAFNKAEPETITQPAQQARLRSLHALRPKDIGRSGLVLALFAKMISRAEDLTRPQLASQILGRGEQHLMIFGPEGHLSLVGVVVGTRGSGLRVVELFLLGGAGGAPLPKRCAAVIVRIVGLIHPILEVQQIGANARFRVYREIDIAPEPANRTPRCALRTQMVRRNAIQVQKP